MTEQEYISSSTKISFTSNDNTTYRVFQKFVPIVSCILRKAFNNASLGKCKLIQIGILSKL